MNDTLIASQGNKEQRQHSSSLIPYSIYDCQIPDSFPNVPMHWHSEFEIDYILQGKGDFICGDEHFPVNPGDVIVISPNMLHAAYPSPNRKLNYIAFVFHASMLGIESNDRSSTHCIRPLVTGQLRVTMKYDTSHPDYSVIHSLAETIVNCANKNNAYDDLLLKSILLQLFWYFEKNDNLSSFQYDDISYSSLIRPALEYMTYYYMDSITINELAAKCSISSSHFMNSFKKAVGCSAIEFLTHLRIKAACTALTDTTEDISTISYNCGFNNLSNFNKQFKKITGISPRDYRKR
ncbi:AraC family transcriptional regulator [Anaerocolumna sp. AGMB13020]|uniref:AraC family transcriptional regulator n=1 Tax=Anaerocolumna sp. AGMB13020 TaxID=3081750 RepID=UPI0029553041|nr:AraC family transcriptional regulator [Anaerocolumna sp. AGMB13020]WOO37973.1 AraC family transcriptional regulator [Anaerocolumna sp. AGMB13020]